MADTPVEVPESLVGLLTGANTAVFVTVAPDGSPSSTPVWFLWEGGEVLVSTRSRRPKHRNVERDPRVSFTVVDPENPMSYLEIRGTATAEDDPECSTRDRVAAKHGFDGAAFDPPDVERTTLRIRPERVLGR